MLEHGFLERSTKTPTVRELLRAKQGETPGFVTISAHQKVAEAIGVMERYSISQLPVVRDGEVASLADVIGSLQDRALLDRVFKNADALHEDVASAMQGPLATVEADASVDEIVTALTGGSNAVVVADARQAGRGRHPLRPARLPRARALVPTCNASCNVVKLWLLRTQSWGGTMSKRFGLLTLICVVAAGLLTAAALAVPPDHHSDSEDYSGTSVAAARSQTSTRGTSTPRASRNSTSKATRSRTSFTSRAGNATGVQTGPTCRTPRSGASRCTTTMRRTPSRTPESSTQTTAPGHGVLFHDVGNIQFDDGTGEVIAIHGPHDVFEQGDAAFCNALLAIS